MFGALGRFMVALGMRNRAQSKILRFHFLFPSPYCPCTHYFHIGLSGLKLRRFGGKAAYITFS